MKHAIKEGKQVGVIYHVCVPKSFIYNIKNDAITPGSFSNVRDGGEESISFTRNDKYIVDTVRHEFMGFQIVLDGDKISERYSVEPFADYDHGYTGKDSEAESVIFGRPLKDLHEYIIGINVLINERKADNSFDDRKLFALSLDYCYATCKKLNVPCNVIKYETYPIPSAVPDTLNGLINYYNVLCNYKGGQIALALKQFKNDIWKFSKPDNSVYALFYSPKVHGFIKTNPAMLLSAIAAVKSSYPVETKEAVFSAKAEDYDFSTANKRYSLDHIKNLLNDPEYSLRRIEADISMELLSFSSPRLKASFIDREGNREDYVICFNPII